MARLHNPFRGPPSSFDEQPEEHRQLAERVKRRYEQEMEPLHRQYRDRWDELNGLYFNYDLLKGRWREAKEWDEEAGKAVLLDSAPQWGGNLIIPYAYATTETFIPRIISRPPKFLGRALESWAEPLTQPIQDSVNQQLSEINIERKLSPTVRRATKLGLGAQFLYWDEEKRTVMRWGRDRLGRQVPVETEIHGRRGPMLEDVDIYDLFWDPTAKNVETCQDILYRTWRSFDYIAKKVQNEEWFAIDLEAVKRMGKSQRRHDVWQDRLGVQGIEFGSTLTEGNIHEVWQYFTRERVVTILDGVFVVQDDVSPFFHRDLPFQIYRPTEIEGQFAGLSVIDAIKDLISEVSTLRNQRRDAATVAINPPTFYQRGMVEHRHMKVGPGVWIPVSGDIREAVFQPQLKDIPASGYMEEDRIKQDIEMTSGMSDVLAGAAGSGQSAGSETATGIQMIQAAANVRIGLMARNLLLETLQPTGNQILELNRQHRGFGSEPVEIRVEDRTQPKGYRFVTLKPEDWLAPIELVPEEGSNEPENRPERIQQAIQFYQLLSDSPLVNQTQLVTYVLDAYGIQNPEAYLEGQIQLNPEIAVAVGEAIAGAIEGLGHSPEEADEVAKATMGRLMTATGVSSNGAQAEQPVQPEA